MALGKLIKSVADKAGGGLLNGAANIIDKFVTDPDKKLEAQKELELARMQHAKDMAEIDIKAAEIDAKQLETVNQTMREESKSEHFLQWSWRPLIGYVFMLVIINNYVVLPYLKNRGFAPIEIPDDIWMAILVILGAASAGRGWMKVEKVKKSN